MATKACAFQSHRGLFSMKKQHSAKPATSPTSVQLPSSLQKRNTNLLICRAERVAGEVVEVTDDTWTEQIIKSEIPVIVKFWAPSCGPCKVVEPVISEVAKEYAGKVACYKINTDDCLKMASQYGVRSIPTVLLFKDGKQIECITGIVRKSSFSAILGKHL